MPKSKFLSHDVISFISFGMLLADRLSILEGDWREGRLLPHYLSPEEGARRGCGGGGDYYLSPGEGARPTFHPEGWRARHILSLLCHYLFLVVNVLHITIDSAQLFFKGLKLPTYHFSLAPTHMVSHIYQKICRKL
jgi:hypothetical protein